MSEYQFYRFECLDNKLDNQDCQQLRTISSRADITTSSFKVEYNYSDLKADPNQLMLQYFDVGFYFASWGTIVGYIKLPIDTVPTDLLKCNAYDFEVHSTNEFQILTFTVEDFYEHLDYFDEEQAKDFFQHLAELRDGLIEGDWRLIYFMWLKSFEFEDDLYAIPLIQFDFDNLSGQS